jgi:hypothetical protein
MEVLSENPGGFSFAIIFVKRLFDSDCEPREMGETFRGRLTLPALNPSMVQRWLKVAVFVVRDPTVIRE